MKKYLKINIFEKDDSSTNNTIMSLDMSSEGKYATNNNTNFSKENRCFSIIDSTSAWTKDLESYSYHLEDIEYHNEMSESGKIVMNIIISSPLEDFKTDYSENPEASHIQNVISELESIKKKLETEKEKEKEKGTYKKVNIFSIQSALVSLLKEKYISVDVYNTKDEKDISITKSYVIFDVSFVQQKTDIVILKLVAYSRDKYMSQDLHSQCIVGSKLSKIYENTVEKCLGADSYITTINDSYNLQIPYSVQYNESTYDYLCRVSSKYGNAMYFDDLEDKICFGWNSSENKTFSEEGAYILGANLNSTVSKPQSKYVTNNYIDGIKSYGDEGNNTTKVVNAEFGSDEMYKANKFKNKNEKYTEMSDVYFPNLSAFKVITDIVAQRSYTDMVLALGLNSIFSGTDALKAKNENNDLYHEHTHTKDDNDNDKEIEGVTYSDGSSTYGTEFFANLRHNAMLCEEEKITIILDLQTAPLDIYLGTLIKISEIDYVVIDKQISLKNDKYNYEIIVVKYEYAEQYSLLRIDTVKKATTHTAFVVDNIDPLCANRVRICYPWQDSIIKDSISGVKEDIKGSFKSKYKSASPWIRVSTLYATNGYGFSFVPSIGDEVVVKYENGNIESPYVAGSLFSTESDILGYDSFVRDKIISCASGQKIVFREGSSVMNFLASFGSIYEHVMPENIDGINDDDFDGDIEFTDKYGIYSFRMSTTDRSVDIKSSVGNVGVKAFTGIDISAPNGDISISGKNVKIEAGNRLNLISGVNLESYSMFTKDKKKRDVAADMFKSKIEEFIGTFFDLSFFRCAIEALVKPVNGSLKIRSATNMMYEVADGEVALVDSEYTNKDIISSVNLLNEILNSIFQNSTPHKRAEIAEKKRAYKAVYDANILNLDNFINLFNANVPNFDNDTDIDDIVKHFDTKIPNDTNNIDENTQKFKLKNNRVYSDADLDKIADVNNATPVQIGNINLVVGVFNQLASIINEIVDIYSLIEEGTAKRFDTILTDNQADDDVKKEIKGFLTKSNKLLPVVEKIFDIPTANENNFKIIKKLIIINYIINLSGGELKFDTEFTDANNQSIDFKNFKLSSTKSLDNLIAEYSQFIRRFTFENVEIGNKHCRGLRFGIHIATEFLNDIGGLKDAFDDSVIKLSSLERGNIYFANAENAVSYLDDAGEMKPHHLGEADSVNNYYGGNAIRDRITDILNEL